LVRLLLLSLLPSLALVPTPRFWSPHYLYIPLVFSSMLLAQATSRRPRVGTAVLVAICALFSVMSLVDSRRYKSDETLWTSEVEQRPQCREGHFYLGEASRESMHLEAAVEHYQAALEPVQGYLAYLDQPAANQNLGWSLLALGRPAEARARFNLALTVVQDAMDRRRLVHNLAAAAFALGEADETLRLLAPEMARPDAFAQSRLLYERALQLKAGVGEVVAPGRSSP
jgi:tetratricopeptide (TPR) repeat protein